MTASQTPAQWSYGGKKLEHVGNVGNTGRSTGYHLHGELRDPSTGNPKDWTNTEAASNVFFQKPDGAIDRLYIPTEDGKFKLNPAAVKTSPFGQRDGRLHTGNDYGLAGGTKLFVPRDILTGSFSGFNDPNGYGNAVDIPTAMGTLRFGHLQGPANKLTIGEPAATGDSSTTATATATPQPQAEPQKQNPLSTAVNIVLNLGNKKDKDEEGDMASYFLKQYMAQAMQVPDYTKMIMSGGNPYETA